jgi:hypothetical protein
VRTRTWSLTLVALLGVCGVAGGQTRSAAERRLDDLAVVRDQYVQRTRAYTPAARNRALALIAEARLRAATLTKADLHLLLMEVAALADNAHDAVSFGTDQARPDWRMPYRVAWFPDALLIVRATGDASDLAGARIEAIDGVTPDALYQRLRRFAGGVDSQRKIVLGTVLESPPLLRAAGVPGADDRIVLRAVLRDGRRVERTVIAVPGVSIPGGFGFERLLAPDPIDPSDATWTTALARTAAPIALREGNALYRMEPLLDGSALYVQFRSKETSAGPDVDRFQQRVVAAIGLQHPTDVILDLRFHTGGDLQRTLGFMRTLPERVTGKVYVLIGRYTFSSGIVSAAAVKKAGANVVIAGEPPGDRLRVWSEGGNTCLPDSGFCLHYTDGLFDLARGCNGESGCYGDQFDVNVGRLDPEIEAPLTASDYLVGRDRALETVLARLR